MFPTAIPGSANDAATDAGPNDLGAQDGALADMGPSSCRTLNGGCDPLTACDDTSGQVRLEFDTQDEAVEYAKKAGLTFRVEPAAERKRLVKSYSANFDANRKQPWTH